MKWIFTAIVFLSFCYGTTATAFSIDEGSDGDLSGIDAFPTSLTLQSGDNALVGSAGQLDFDIFHINIPSPLAITAIALNQYSPSAGVSFLGIQEGNTWTAGIGNGVSGSALIGWTLFGANNIGDDLLPIADTTNNGASGFDIPLSAGDYVFLLQDTGTPISYDLTFTAAPVPLPGGVILFLSGLAGLVISRRSDSDTPTSLSSR